MTFSGSSGQKVSLGANSTTFASLTALGVYNPDGSTLASHGSFTTAVNFHMTLPVTGTYTIYVDPPTTTTGTATFTLSSEVNGGVLTINGASVPVTISRVGQRARITFTNGTANQQATVRITNNTMGSVTLALLRPDQTQQTASTSSASSFNLATQTLVTTGTYTILVDPGSTNTGSMNVSVTSP
jgi:hypothetical protein